MRRAVITYDGSPGPIFRVDPVLFIEVPADTLGSNRRLGPYECLHTLQGRSGPFPDEVASDESLQLD